MKYVLAASVMLVLLACEDTSEKAGPVYPETKKIEHSDTYHGVEISDPYRWLENDTSQETEAWVKTENELTFGFLSKIPFRDKIRKRMDDLLNYSRQTSPYRVGNYYFIKKNNGLQNQDVIYFKEGLNGEEMVFLDPNQFSEDGTVTFNISGYSDDNEKIILSKSEAGSDWRMLITYEISSKTSIGDTLRWIKFSGADWYNGGFYYSRYPEPESGSDYSASNSFHSVYYHKIGQEQSKDKLVFQDKEHANRYHWVNMTDDKKYLVLYVAEGTDGYECYFRKADRSESFTPLFTGFDHKNSIVDHINGRFIVKTDIDAENYRLISVDPNNPSKENWIEIIPEKETLLQSVSSAGGFLFLKYLENACNKVYRMSMESKELIEIDLPPAGSISGFGGKVEDSILFYSYSSFTSPGRIYKYDVESNTSSVYFESDLDFNMDDYESKQLFYTSKDGSKISMFLVHKKGIQFDGNNPCMLYGYGGFNISLTPNFSTSRLVWLENGGIFAMPNLRGGGEYGEAWHKAGMLLNKQNVFDDFIAAAEFLIKEKYTSSEKLVISGRSNGGLLVGAVMTQRPNLMKVALPGVGVLDMLRYHKFTVGHGWIPEYGSSDDEVYFKNLLSYSPLHNIKENTEYPATLIYTGDHDDRVVPAHSFKFAATLQEKSKGQNPILIRIETQAGHGSGKPISKRLDEEADKMAFSFYCIGSTLSDQ